MVRSRGTSFSLAVPSAQLKKSLLNLLDFMSLEESIDETYEAARLYFNNKFIEAQNALKPWINASMYHALVFTTFSVIEAGYSLDPEEFKGALKQLDFTLALCNKNKKHFSFIEAVAHFFSKNPGSYKETEAHALLINAEYMMLKALLTFFADPTFSSFVKAGLKIKKSFITYKECECLLKLKVWENCLTKAHFESGIKLGLGTLNVVISMLPHRVIKILQFLGLHANKGLGIQYLEEGIEMNGALRQIPCIISFLVYHLVLVYYFSFKDGDYERCGVILTEKLEPKFPNGVFYLMFHARLQFVRGNLDEAIEWYSRMYASQNEMLYINGFCFSELVWIYAIKSEWENALIFADNILDLYSQSMWFAHYQKAAILIMMDNFEKYDSMINEAMVKIFKDRARIQGRKMQSEMFIFAKVQRYRDIKEALMLPMYEILYLWNYFKLFANNKQFGEIMVVNIDRCIAKFNETSSRRRYDNDNKAMLFLLKGACSREMGLLKAAVDALEHAITLGHKVKFDYYILAYATAEMGLTQLKMGNKETAIIYLKEAHSSPANIMVTRLQFKIKALLQDLNSSGNKVKAQLIK